MNEQRKETMDFGMAHFVSPFEINKRIEVSWLLNKGNFTLDTFFFPSLHFPFRWIFVAKSIQKWHVGIIFFLLLMISFRKGQNCIWHWHWCQQICHFQKCQKWCRPIISRVCGIESKKHIFCYSNYLNTHLRSHQPLWSIWCSPGIFWIFNLFIVFIFQYWKEKTVFF